MPNSEAPNELPKHDHAFRDYVTPPLLCPMHHVEANAWLFCIRIFNSNFRVWEADVHSTISQAPFFVLSCHLSHLTYAHIV
eukprot:scaffold1603_cov415-Prasinococcus_capsulatus_cf.AAC.4